jgi:hypothetical protein
VAYSLVFFSEKRTSWLVALAIVARVTFLLIPNLKYVWFQGTAGDQQIQYALANNVYNKGHISSIDPVYSTTPFIHLSFSIFSTILGIPVVDSLKYVPVLLSPIYPLLTFILMKRMNFSQKTTVLKFGLFVSSIPFNIQTYVVTGGQFGTLLAFLVLSSLVALSQEKDRRYWIILVLLVFALATAHSVTSTFVTIFLFAAFVFQRIPQFKLGHFLKGSIILAVTSILSAWLLFSARAALEALTRVVFFAVPRGTTASSEVIPLRFLELLRADVFAGLRALLVYDGADIFLLITSIGGLILLLKMRRELNYSSKFLLIYGSLIILVIPVAAVLGVGPFRITLFVSPLFAVFSGILAFHISRRRMWIGIALCCLIVILATFELYTCQPLLPSANVILKNLPTTEPVGYVNQVTSIYQREMIAFAENHINGQIASDVLTKNQIVGLTKYDFSSVHLIEYYPLDASRPKQRFDFFLIHFHGKSGTFGERAEVRTQSLILDVIYNSSIVYTNGESYALNSLHWQP